MPPNGGISPILRILPSSSGVPLSSTPLLKNRDTSEHRNVKEENQRDHISQHVQENSKKPEFEYLDFDLFEDWDTSNFLQEKVQEEPSFLTLSQAVELIEEAHKAEELNKIKEVKTGSNDSIDLLAGEVIESEKNLFPELLNLSKSESLENKTSLSGKKFTPNCKSVIFGDSKSVIVGFEDSLKKSNSSGKIKSSVAQKLNFDGENITSLYSKKLDQCSENNLDCKTIEFDSDNSVDAILQLSFFENIKADKLSDLPKKQLDKIANVIEKSSVEFIDDSFNCKKKRGKFFRIKESDSEDDQSNSLLVKQKKVKKRNAEEVVFENN